MGVSGRGLAGAYGEASAAVQCEAASRPAVHFIPGASPALGIRGGYVMALASLGCPLP
jgi:hypothetical protein